MATLTASPEKVKFWLEGSLIYGDAISFQYWYEHRHFIAQTINRSGTILDIGCANGFLLRSLLAWADHPLVPYGIDPDTERLAHCHTLFPKHPRHFVSVPLGRLSHELGGSLPRSFDFVYWNVWDDFAFGDSRFEGYLENAYAAVKEGGRLIFGFYDADVTNTKRKIAWLSKNFLTSVLLEPVWNIPHDEALVWMDKPHAVEG